MNIFNNEPKHQSATDAVLWRLKNKGQINQLQCLERYGNWRLSSIIYCLRKQGYAITSKETEVKTRCGKKTRVSTYYL